ncbi:uncharacterized protein [Rutidosis leptorrhynchoides]|uniref:uncharacterized protein n=1 Tax=Rutidosis leptorrhynchoides TaxID=125765 RepID=UPI003A99D81E
MCLMHAMIHNQNMQAAHILAQAFTNERNASRTVVPVLGAVVTKLLRRMRVLGSVERFGYRTAAESEEIGYKLLNTWEYIRIDGEQLIVTANPALPDSEDRTVLGVRVTGFRPDTRTRDGRRHHELRDEDDPTTHGRPTVTRRHSSIGEGDRPRFPPYHYHMGDLPGHESWFAQHAIFQNLDHFIHYAGRHLNVPPYPHEYPVLVSHRDPRGAGPSHQHSGPPSPPRHHCTQRTVIPSPPREQSTRAADFVNNLFDTSHMSTHRDTSTDARASVWDQAASRYMTEGVTQGIDDTGVNPQWGRDLQEGMCWRTGPMIYTST